MKSNDYENREYVSFALRTRGQSQKALNKNIVHHFTLHLGENNLTLTQTGPKKLV